MDRLIRIRILESITGTLAMGGHTVREHDNGQIRIRALGGRFRASREQVFDCFRHAQIRTGPVVPCYVVDGIFESGPDIIAADVKPVSCAVFCPNVSAVIP